jgi:flagellar basal-body rod protein FlgB
VGASGIGLFDLADKRLGWLERRQELLAQNVANANTPGWKSHDLKSFATVLAGRSAELAPVRTDPGHLPGKPAGANQRISAKGERAPDGNTVKLDEELTKVADTESAQATTTGVYTKYMSFFRMALGR